MVACARCGKEIAAGLEVKKGFLTKKNYHRECAAWTGPMRFEPRFRLRLVWACDGTNPKRGPANYLN